MAKRSRMKIAYVDHALEQGGAEHSLLDLLQRLDRERFEPVLLCRQGADWAGRAGELGVAIEPVLGDSPIYDVRRDEIGGWRRHAGHGWQAHREASRIAGHLQRIGADIVHSNALKTHLVGGFAARRAGVPLMWHLRDILSPGGARRLLTWAARRLSPQIICISEAVRASLGDEGLRAQVIYNGVALERFRPGPPPEALTQELGIKPTDRVIAIVSRLTPWKGHRTLLDALPRVVSVHADLRLLVVGDTTFWNAEYADELKALADDLGVADNVRFLGRRDDVPELLAASELLALPSEDEPFGRVIIEAMAMALPVVATATGGVPEIVVEKQTGLLVPPRDPEALADALLAAMADPEAAAEMGRAGRERVCELFDARATAERVQELYEQAG